MQNFTKILFFRTAWTQIMDFQFVAFLPRTTLIKNKYGGQFVKHFIIKNHKNEREDFLRWITSQLTTWARFEFLVWHRCVAHSPQVLATNVLVVEELLRVFFYFGCIAVSLPFASDPWPNPKEFPSLSYFTQFFPTEFIFTCRLSRIQLSSPHIWAWCGE